MLHYEMIQPSELLGGQTINESAEIFKTILEGKGTIAQNNVVVVNSQLAIKCYHPTKSLEECRMIAEDSLLCGKALKSLKMLIDMQS
jgi:anthranilate phosphoribosyltransferase